MGESVGNWRSQGNCANRDPDELFVVGAQQNIAKRVCIGCVVRMECLSDALDNRIEFGVWGGMTERERRALVRRHPGVPSWRRLFETAVQRGDAIPGTAGTGRQPKAAPALGDSALDAVTPPLPRPDTDQTL